MFFDVVGAVGVCVLADIGVVTDAVAVDGGGGGVFVCLCVFDVFIGAVVVAVAVFYLSFAALHFILQNGLALLFALIVCCSMLFLSFWLRLLVVLVVLSLSVVVVLMLSLLLVVKNS